LNAKIILTLYILC